jgi:hypothetical protein
MKELSIKEKAKRYDKAIKVLNSITIYPNSKDFIKL